MHLKNSINNLDIFIRGHGPLSRLETSLKEKTLLEGVYVYVHNFPDRDIQRIQMIVHNNGGWVLPILIERVTHVIPNKFN